METPNNPRGFAHAPEDRLLRRLTRAINVIESWNLPPYPAADWGDFDFENIPTIYRQLLRQISLLKKISSHDLDSELVDTYIDQPDGLKTHLFKGEVDRLIVRINRIDRALNNIRPAVWEIYDENGQGLAMLKFVADQPITGPVINWNNSPRVEPDTVPIPASITLNHYDIPDYIEHHLDKIRVLVELLEDLIKPLVNFVRKVDQTESSQMLAPVQPQEMPSSQRKGGITPPNPVYNSFEALFINPDDITPCVNALRNITPPLISADRKWIGRKKNSPKATFCAWIRRLEDTDKISFLADKKVLVPLINDYFPGINFGADARTFNDDLIRVDYFDATILP